MTPPKPKKLRTAIGPNSGIMMSEKPPRKAA
jgi:hypothetical protein